MSAPIRDPWAHLRSLFEAVLEQPGPLREGWISSEVDDPGLRDALGLEPISGRARAEAPKGRGAG